VGTGKSGRHWAHWVAELWGYLTEAEQPWSPSEARFTLDPAISEFWPVERKDTSDWSESANGSSQMDALSLESASKEAYFSRVETFTISFLIKPWPKLCLWAGKPHDLSPLVCAKYGWTNVECDMLKCSSCQAFLCVSLQLTFDFNKYKERCLELKKALCTAHEKFCFWPDSPCPDRFSMLLVDEPRALLQDFLDRFQSLCQLELQLPSLRPEDVKNMSLTEEKISLLLQLIGEELEHKTEGEKPPMKFATEILPVHVPACILALCGWTCSITPPAPAERFLLMPASPRRMLTRSQDTLPPGSEQQEKSPSPAISRPRGWDVSVPMDRSEVEVASPTLRSRPVTRSMGQGDNVEVPSSPFRRAKRTRLCSSSSSDTSLRSFFDPSTQHRDWCPWVNAVEGGETLEDTAAQTEKEPAKAEPGWRVVLNTLLATRKCDRVPETEPVSLSVKSCKVFRIFRQWESMNSS
uniref:Zinc finger C3HC-type containing 1 n=1 Tax=Strix occidentalis caurina TaxID=311401 RepID=A0A8D0EIV6_STROC